MAFVDAAAIVTIHPLVHLEHVGTVDDNGHHFAIYTAHCRECGNVTRQESGFTVNDAPSEQAHMYARRHLSRHLKELADEIIKFNR